MKFMAEDLDHINADRDLKQTLSEILDWSQEAERQRPDTHVHTFEMFVCRTLRFLFLRLVRLERRGEKS